MSNKALEIKITFGKYKGLTLGELIKKDGNYAQWLIKKAYNGLLRMPDAYTIYENADKLLNMIELRLGEI